MITDDILNAWGLITRDHQPGPFGSGLINRTYKVSGRSGNYILQQINTAVFKSPDNIAENLKLIQDYLKDNYPAYLFAAPLPTVAGKFLYRFADGSYYRLLPFILNSHTVNFVQNKNEAFEAARQFGKFSRLLNNFDTGLLKYTLPDFHNLKLRFEQFIQACKTAKPARLNEAATEIKEVYLHKDIINTWQRLTENNMIPVRVIHHDTKINNVLFDDNGNGLCVVDLDTVMPGYFFSDTGDMMRTYLSPANEEATDLDKIYVREDVLRAIYRGYMLEMGNVLTPTEKQNFIFSGQLMMYMQAMRFLTDFLNNDAYYGSKYPGHNLKRAQNQFKLLQQYLAIKGKLQQLITAVEKEL